MGISSPQTTGVYGRSYGGLDVNMMLNKRPELFGAAVSESGVNSIIDSPVINPDTGEYWKDEFGDPQDPQQMAWMAKLDVLNNVSATTKYPPTLVEIGTIDGVVNVGNGITYHNIRQGMNNGEVLLYSRIGEGHDPSTLALQTAFLLDRLRPAAKPTS
jgi:prolyl oligopeptidase